ncbi:MAG: ATP-binding cassette domain-containing protein, partial [Rhodospirillaceae bacterium]
VVRVNDPACGPQVLDRTEFDVRFTGIACVLRPGPAFSPGGRPFSPTALLWRQAQRIPVAAATALAATAAIWGGLSAVFMGHTGAGLALAVAGWGGRFIALNRAARHLDRAGTADLLGALRDQGTRYLGSRSHGVVKATLGSFSALATILCGRAGAAVLDVAGALLPLCLLVALAPLYGLATLLGWAVVLAVIVQTHGGRTSPLRKARLDSDEAQGMVLGELANLDILKFAGRHRDALARMAGRHARHISLSQKAGASVVWAHLAPVAGLGGLLALAPDHAAAGLAVLAFVPLLRLPSVAERLSSTANTVRAAHDLLGAPPEPPPTRHSADTLTATALTFGYSAPLLSGVNLHLPIGARIGLSSHGASTGKSTLARLLCGLDAPWSGTVSGPERIALVTAQGVFPAGTVRDALTLFDPGLDDATLVAALREAAAWEIVAPRGGLDAVVAPHGANFSGGERRRLALACALARDPAVVVLDETLDSLDPVLELDVLNRLRAARRAVLLITQRAESLAACDEALLLENGSLRPWSPAEALPPSAPLDGAGRPPPSPEPPVEDLPAAAHALDLAARWHGLPPREVPEGPRSIRALSHAMGLTLRRVRPRERAWWQDVAEPLIVQCRATSRAAVVLPGSLFCRASVHELGFPPRPLNAGVAATLDTDAFAVVPGAGADWTTAGQAAHAAVRAGAPALGTALLLLVTGAVIWPLIGDDRPGVAAAAILAVTASLCSGALWGLRARARMATLLHEGLWSRVLRLPSSIFRTMNPLDLGMPLAALRRLPAVWLPVGLWGIPGAACMVGALLHTPSPWAMGAAGAVIGVDGTLSWLRSRFDRSLRRQDLEADLSLGTTITALPLLRTLGAGDRMLERWLSLSRRQGSLSRRILALENLGAGMRIGLAVGAVAVSADTIAVLGVMGGAWAVGRAVSAVPAARATTAEARPLLLLTPEAGPGDTATPPPFTTLSLRDAAFAYPGRDAMVFENVTLDIAAGDIVAVTGPSGGGKTTLLRLLAGLEHPTAGCLLIDGAPPAPNHLFALRQWMDAVIQDEELPLATLRNHVVGDAAHSLQAVESALDAACLRQDIEALPMGMHTLLRGDHLSAAQVQQLRLARAFLTRPRILFLDEALGALQADVLALILDRLRALGTACVIVSHSQRVIDQADRVYRLDGGRLHRVEAMKEAATR